MANETETKILGIDPEVVHGALLSLGATPQPHVRLVVDWYGLAELYANGIVEGKDPWFLRVRSKIPGGTEITWKGVSELLGASRTHKEINIGVSDHRKAGEFFEALGLVRYAHQEKDRVSYTYQDWSFDVDTYPGMPPYLEIEGTSEGHIQKAIQLLTLQNHTASSEGERTLIQNTYHLNWYDMRF